MWPQSTSLHDQFSSSVFTHFILDFFRFLDSPFFFFDIWEGFPFCLGRALHSVLPNSYCFIKYQVIISNAFPNDILMPAKAEFSFILPYHLILVFIRAYLMLFCNYFFYYFLLLISEVLVAEDFSIHPHILSRACHT